MFSLRLIRTGDASVLASESSRNLGVIFDRILDMSNHIKVVRRASFRQLGHLRSTTGTLTGDSLEKITRAFISSRLDYRNVLLYGLPRSSTSKLQRIQNATARLLTGKKKFDHITPVLRSLHCWLPVEKRNGFNVLLLVYRALHDQAPEYMRDMLQERTNVRTLRPTVSSQFTVPRS